MFQDLLVVMEVGTLQGDWQIRTLRGDWIAGGKLLRTGLEISLKNVSTNLRSSLTRTRGM